MANTRPRGKLYLNGPDWMIQALHHSTWKATGTGNSSQTVIEFDGLLPASELRGSIQTLCRELPQLSGRAARNLLNLAPYWKYSRDARPEIEVTVHELPDARSDDEYQELLTTCVNTPFPRTGVYVRFHLIHRGESRSALAMNFDHRLFDAYGAELLLHAIVEHAEGRVTAEAIADQTTWAAPSLLNKWKERFLSGRTVVRRLLALTPEGSYTPAPPSTEQAATAFHTFALSKTETEQFRNSSVQAGIPMLVPHGMQLAFQAFRRLHEKPLASGERCIASCNVDLRSPEAGWNEMLFNYVSFFLFEEDDDMAKAGGPSLRQLAQQFYDQVKIGFPQSLANAWVLMRILPVPIYGWAIIRNMKRCFGAFNFSLLKDCGVKGDSLLGCKITNVFHTPRIPNLTGAGFYLSEYQGRLNVCIAVHKGVHTAEELQSVEGLFRDSCQI